MQHLGVAFRFYGHFVDICQQTADAKQLICHAEQARSSVLKLARGIAIQLNLDPDLNVAMGPIKTLERIWQKAAGRKHGRVDHVTDICRERLKVESYKDVIELRKLSRNPDFYKEWEEKGIKIIEFEDYFAYPNERGFRGINMLLHVDLGKGRYHVCELQIIHKEMEATLEASHANHKKIRDIKELAVTQGRKLSEKELIDIKNFENESQELHQQDAERLNLHLLEAQKPTYQPAKKQENAERNESPQTVPFKLAA